MKLPKLKTRINKRIDDYSEWCIANNPHTDKKYIRGVKEFSIELKDEVSKCKTRKQIFNLLEDDVPECFYQKEYLNYQKDKYKTIAWDYIIDKAHVDGKYDDRLLDFYKQIDDSDSKYFEELQSIIDTSPNYIRERRYHDKHGIRTRDNLYGIIVNNI